MIELQCDTIPAIKRQILKLLIVHAINVLSKHPKSATNSSKNYSLNAVNIARAARFNGFIAVAILVRIIIFFKKRKPPD